MKINFLMDENITPKSVQMMESLGYTCTSIQDLGKKGITDEEVLEIAIEMNSCLCTCNGKDFIIQIPPRVKIECPHDGLFWAYKIDWTRKTNEIICRSIDTYINKESVEDFKNQIIRVIRNKENFTCEKKYPV